MIRLTNENVDMVKVHDLVVVDSEITKPRFPRADGKPVIYRWFGFVLEVSGSRIEIIKCRKNKLGEHDSCWVNVQLGDPVHLCGPSEWPADLSGLFMQLTHTGVFGRD